MSDTLIVVVLWLLLPFVLAVAIVLSIFGLNHGRATKTNRREPKTQQAKVNKQNNDLEILKQDHQTKIAELNEAFRVLKQNHQIEVAELKKDIKFWKHNSSEYHNNTERNEWFKRIASVPFKNEVEVEVKFVHPLLHFLGFKEDEYRMRVPVNVHAGRQIMTAEADWVVYTHDGHKVTFSNVWKLRVSKEARSCLYLPETSDRQSWMACLKAVKEW